VDARAAPVRWVMSFGARWFVFVRVDGGAWVWDVMGVLLSRTSFTQMLWVVGGLGLVNLAGCVLVRRATVVSLMELAH
jgi:hypothetical protein